MSYAYRIVLEKTDLDRDFLCRMEAIPIVEIDASTMPTLRPMLLSAVKMAQYVSIDLELSGLGDKPDIR